MKKPKNMYEAFPVMWSWPMYVFMFFMFTMNGCLILVSFQKWIVQGMFVGFVNIALHATWLSGLKMKYEAKNKE
jgi:hypothetical protein